jgi:hypothetical protein
MMITVNGGSGVWDGDIMSDIFGDKIFCLYMSCLTHSGFEQNVCACHV